MRGESPSVPPQLRIEARASGGGRQAKQGDSLQQRPLLRSERLSMLGKEQQDYPSHGESDSKGHCRAKDDPDEYREWPHGLMWPWLDVAMA